MKTMKLMSSYKLLLLTAFTVISSFFCISCGKEVKKSEAKASRVIVDDLKERVSFDSVPERVITLAPNLTEMMYELGVQKYLAGNTLYCNYPPEARKIAKVGDMMTLDYERIIAIKPDLIFITVEGNSLDSYNKLKKLGFKVFVSNPRNFAGIKKTYMDMGRIFNDSLKAMDTVKVWDNKYNDIVAKAKNYPHEKCMFLVGLNPLMLAGKNTFINEIITSAGLINAAADSPLNYPIFSREEVLKRNPDCIITTDNTENIYNKLLGSYPEWKSLNAVKNHQVVTGNPDLYLRPGPRFVNALEDLFSKLHYRGNY